MMDENPPMGSNVHKYCDGEWAISGKYGTDGVAIQHFNGSKWEILEKDSETNTGLAGGCYTKEFLRKKGVPEKVISQGPVCNP